MANTFTAVRGWRFGGGQGKSLIAVEGTLVIDTTASGGAVADDMLASMFGLQKIIGPAIITNLAETKIFFGAPDYTGDSLLIGGGAAGVTQDLPNDTYKVYIVGFGATV